MDKAPNKHIKERYPFKQMRETYRVAMSASAFLLGMESIIWKDEDYLRFTTIAEMTQQIEDSNPTHEQFFVAMVTMTRFFKTIVDRLPDPELRAKGQELFNQIAAPYGKWLEVKEQKDEIEH